MAQNSQNQSSQEPQIQQIIKDQIAPIQGGLANTAVVVASLFAAIAVKDFVNPWIKKQTLKISFNREQDREIDQILTIVLSLTNADRVILTRFTNGVYTVDGASIKGCVVTHEVVQIGIAKVGGLINSRISNYANAILKSFVEKPYHTRITDEIVDGAHRAFVEELNTRFSINYFLTAKDLPLGFLTLHWRSPSSKTDFEGVDPKELRGYADSIISRLLNNQNLMAKFINVLPK